MNPNPAWITRIVVYPFFGKSLQAWSADKGKWCHMGWVK